MQAFADLCGLDLPPAALDRYAVRTECAGMESIIDVMVFRRREFLVYVENKILAPEGEDQVDREFRDMRRRGAALGVPVERQYAVFLTPGGRAPISGDPSRWRPVSYGGLAGAFADVLPSVSSDEVRVVLRHWIETVSRFGGGYDVPIV